MQTEPVLIYDGTCGFCTAGVRRLIRLSGRPLTAVASQSDEARQALPASVEVDFVRQLYLVIDGEVHGGAAAVARTLGLNPWLRPLAAVYWLPGIRSLADWAYRQVAARRHALGGTCPLPPASGRD